MHRARLTLPSSNRTCGFPASGSRKNSRHRLTQVPLQVQQAQTLEVPVIGYPFRRSEGSLTPPL